MSENKNRRLFKLAIVSLLTLVMLFSFVGCKKKDAAPAASTATTATTATTSTAPKTTTSNTAPVTTPAKVVETAKATVAAVAEKVEEVKEEAKKVEEVVSSSSVYPVKLSTKIGGDEFSIEAYDGYGYVYFPEKYTEEDVDAFLDPLVLANKDISDVVGWTVEEPGVAIIAYPFGLTPVEIAGYADALVSAAR